MGITEWKSQKILKKVTAEIRKLEKLHGVGAVRWALNKYIRFNREKLLAEMLIKEKQEELEKLKKEFNEMEKI